MDNVTVIKTENNENSDSDNDSLELDQLLQEVKKEGTTQSISESQKENENTRENFIEELYREEFAENSPDSVGEPDDIEQLQKLLEKRKKELRETEENHSKEARSRSPDPSLGVKRKVSTQSNADTDKQNGYSAKRQKDGSSGSTTSSNRLQQATDDSQNNSHSQSNDEPMHSADEVPPVSEFELERLLKDEDSDEETSNQVTAMPNANYNFPPNMGMSVPMFDQNQMMANMPQIPYPMMYYPQQFYPHANMINMPMMGYGLPPMNMNLPQNSGELECLPVVKTSGIPTFKRIKLENKSKPGSDEAEQKKLSAKEKCRKIFEKCNVLLEKLKVTESSGKFIYTPTVMKINTDNTSNSILQKTTNVSYEYHSIGPKLNISDWGLKEISQKNATIAKKIAISAEKYFAKIAECQKAGKLVKLEKKKIEEKQQDTEIEVEEPTLSSFLKNSMTQTDDLVCAECIERKRIVGHHIGVQATAYTSSIGSQTTPELDENNRLTMGLSENQVKALFEFANLIREPINNTPEEHNKLRGNLMNIYDLSQRRHRGPMPNISSHANQTLQSFATTREPSNPRDPRFDSRPNTDQRRFTQPGMAIPTLMPTAMQAPRQNINNYQPHNMQIQNQQNHAAQFPGHPRPGPGYPAAAMHDRPGQPNDIHFQNQREPVAHFPAQPGPAAQFPGPPAQVPGNVGPAFLNHEYAHGAMQNGRGNYGRGVQRR